MAEAMERQAAGQAHARLAESAVTQAEALARRHAGERERLERERAALGVGDGAAARRLETEAEAARLGDEIARVTDRYGGRRGGTEGVRTGRCRWRWGT